MHTVALRIIADPVVVRHSQGLLHGFLVLRDGDNKVIAAGDLSQTASGARITSQLVFHFDDGSLYDEKVAYVQRHTFQLLTYHLVSKGKSFKHDTDLSIDSSSGHVKVVDIAEDGKKKTYDEYMKLPGDLANGMITTLLLDFDSTKPQTNLSMVVSTPKPRLVTLLVTPGPESSFKLAGTSHKAISYNIKIDIGGLVGAVAPLVGKQPPDCHVWVFPGKTPGFLKMQGPLFEGGPVWQIELASPEWHAH